MFGWFKKKEEPTAPPLVRVPVDPGFAPVLAEYAARRKDERLALCCEGGGAKGRWQAGFLARAAEVGLLRFVDLAAGTSVGGLNALVASRYLDESPDLQAVAEVWRGITKDGDIYTGKLPTDFWAVVRGIMAGKLKAASWLDTAPLQALVKKHLGGHNDMAFPVYTVATDYASKSFRVLGPRVDAADRALATSAVPGAFPAHEVLGLGMMDGGCSLNCPYPVLLERGATKLLVLYCDPDPMKVRRAVAPATTLNTLTGALAALMQAQSDRAYEELEAFAQIRDLMHLSPVEVAHFYPSAETGGLLEFGARLDLLQQGYDDAVRYLTPEKVRSLLEP
jgi:NTE family protein